MPAVINMPCRQIYTSTYYGSNSRQYGVPVLPRHHVWIPESEHTCVRFVDAGASPRKNWLFLLVQVAAIIFHDWSSSSAYRASPQRSPVSSFLTHRRTNCFRASLKKSKTPSCRERRSFTTACKVIRPKAPPENLIFSKRCSSAPRSAATIMRYEHATTHTGARHISTHSGLRIRCF